MSINRKPLILITNDDGISASGINQLIESVRPLGEIVAIAPDSARSGMSSAITAIHPLRLNLVKKEENLTVYSCTGTPVDCVKLGVNEVLRRKPDLLIAGINHGSNAAICVIYSGTIGATLEGCICGIPSIGVSLCDHSPDADFTQAAQYGRIVAEKVLTDGLPQGVCLNLNIPAGKEVQGLKVCSQTKGYWAKEFQLMQDPLGKTVYWLTGEFVNEEPDNEQSDEWALNHGYAALVPLQINLTAYRFLEKMRESYEL
ncbi:MAG: 5'/3'-nucleotidase SurE [Dysgonamonadaceae bacterium]|jgi:5'-nucleotidase|nr:5'/3'-nucleotidase SurE [Dysgonamonadaceae bacterium]